MKKGSNYFPMRELERRSGFPRSTILFYVQEGLLPQPRKTAKNMAVYDNRFVDGLHLIQELKDKHKLSLPQIKEVLQRTTGGVGLELLLDVRDRAFRQLTMQREQGLLSWDELVSQSGLPEDVLRRLEQNDCLIVQPVEGSNRYHSDNVIAARLLQQMLALGFPLETYLAIHQELARLADMEIKALMDHVSSAMVQRGKEAQEIIDTAQTGFDVLQSVVTLLHSHKLYRILHSTDWPKYFAGEPESGNDDEAE